MEINKLLISIINHAELIIQAVNEQRDSTIFCEKEGLERDCKGLKDMLRKSPHNGLLKTADQLVFLAENFNHGYEQRDDYIKSMQTLIYFASQILSVLRHEESRDKEEMKKYWYKNIHGFVFFHGTSHYFVKEILEHGLDPKRKPEIFTIAIEARERMNKVLGGIFALHDGLGAASLDRPKVFLALEKQLAAAFKIPETLRIGFTVTFRPRIEEMGMLVQSRGDYEEYLRQKQATRKGFERELSRVDYETIDFDELKGEYDFFSNAYRVFEEFARDSRVVVLQVDAIGVLDELPQIISRSIVDFDYYMRCLYPVYSALNGKDIIYVYRDTYDRNRNASGEEVAITKRIDPKYIRLSN